MGFDALIKTLPHTAISPEALILYLALIAAWIIVAIKVKRHNNLLKNLEKLPDKDRIKAFVTEIHGVQLTKGVTPEDWIRIKKHEYYFLGFLALCAALVILAVLVFFDNKRTENPLPINIEDSLSDVQRERINITNDVLNKNIEFSSRYRQKNVELSFSDVWSQFFEKGRIFYNISERWAIVLFGDTTTLNKFPIYEVLISSGPGMTEVRWEIVENLLQKLPEREVQKYKELILNNKIRGGIGTLYLSEGLHKKLGDPLGLEFVTQSVLVIRSTDWLVLGGVKNRDGDADNTCVIEMFLNTNHFLRYASAMLHPIK